MNYIKRIVDDKIVDNLKFIGAVQIRGPKWCGKTTSAKMHAKSVLEMQNPDMQSNYIELANTKPSILLKGDKPRLIDEWQIAPKLWNAVKYSVDNTSEVGQYILTGSATPVYDSSLHSGVGRFSIIDMKPMSLYESSDSNGKISLNDLINKNINIDGIKSDLTFEKMVFALCRGGWPNSLNFSENLALKIPQNYIDVLCENDISIIDGVKRDPILGRNILKCYARQCSTIDSDQTLYDDIKSNAMDISETTIKSYINIFKRLFIIEEIPAWNPNIRSKTSIRTSPKKTFIDPSLAVASLGCSIDDLMLDFNTLGLLFENLVNRDLSIYAKKYDGRLQHYRDRYGLECDNIIYYPDGSYALIEVKLGGDKIKEAEKHLLELQKLLIESENIKIKPKKLIIITATDLAYKTENNVYIVPIGCLKD